VSLYHGDGIMVTTVEKTNCVLFGFGAEKVLGTD